MFFLDFLRLFVPELVDDFAYASLVPLDKEVFSDVTSVERHEVDLLIKRLGTLSPERVGAIVRLPLERLEHLADAVFEIGTDGDLEAWLS